MKKTQANAVCEQCGADVRRVPLRGQKPRVFLTINPEPARWGTVQMSRSMHGEDEGEIVARGRRLHRLHAETCPQLSLL